SRWSRDREGVWSGADPGDTLTLELPLKTAGRYEVFASFTRGPNQAVVRISLDGEPLGNGPLDLHHGETEPTGSLSLGMHVLPAGDRHLVVTIDQANPKSRREFGLDYLYLAP